MPLPDHGPPTYYYILSNTYSKYVQMWVCFPVGVVLHSNLTPRHHSWSGIVLDPSPGVWLLRLDLVLYLIPSWGTTIVITRIELWIYFKRANIGAQYMCYTLHSACPKTPFCLETQKHDVCTTQSNINLFFTTAAYLHRKSHFGRAE